MELLPDTIRTIASYLDDDVLQVLFMTGAIPSLIDISQDQRFWYERVQTLAGLKLPWMEGSWSRAYAILKQELTREEPNFVNDEDNFIVTTVLLAMGFDPTVGNNRAIKWAATLGALEIVKVLFADKRVDPSDVRRGGGALALAAYEGHFEIVKLLLTNPRVNTTTALQIAVIRKDNPEIVKLLLSDIRTDPNQALVSSASHEDIFRLILQDPRTDRSNANEALKKASQEGHEGIVRILLSLPEVDPSVHNNLTIELAVGTGIFSLVKLLLSDPRVDPSARNNSSIGLAAKIGNYQIVKLLLEDPRVDPTAAGSIALNAAALQDRVDIVELLLRHPRQNRDYNNAITVRAIAVGHYDTAKIMLASGNVDLNVVLGRILQDKNVDMVKYILDRVKIDPADLASNIRIAIAERQMEVVRALLQQPNVDVNKMLPEAIQEGRMSLVKMLLGDTRLDMSVGYEIDFIEAAKRGHSLVILILLRDGRIDPTFNNNQALREARTAGHAEVVRLLLADPRVQEAL